MQPIVRIHIPKLCRPYQQLILPHRELINLGKRSQMKKTEAGEGNFLIICFRYLPASNYSWSSLSAVCTFSINFLVQLFFSKKSTTFSVSSSMSSPSSM